jgi:hypothetical protein
VQSGSTQEIAGQHMVGPDGMVSLRHPDLWPSEPIAVWAIFA